MVYGTCEYAYRKPGCDTVHCSIQKAQARKWDFCAHQYLCNQTRRYEMNTDATACTLPKKAKKALVEQGKAALDEAERVFSDELQPKLIIKE